MKTSENRSATAWHSMKKVWMKFARVMGWCNTHLLLAIFFVILGIPAFFIRLSKSAIFHHLPDDRLSYWQEKENPPHTIDRAKHQF